MDKKWIEVDITFIKNEICYAVTLKREFGDDEYLGDVHSGSEVDFLIRRELQ